MPKVLVIEDNLEIRNSVCEILELNNFNVCEAEDGDMGISMLDSERPDVILCDVMMPNRDGWQTLEFVRTSSEYKNLPFIFTTAMSNTRDMRKGMMMGADDYITKPFYSNDLLNSIQTVLDKRKNLLDEMKSKIQHEDSVDPLSYKNQYKDFEDSLERAKLVQEATLPSAETLDRILKDYMLFYQPRDIISGDFYWVKEINGNPFVAVADCTGHGVPAALMTMACINMLNFIQASNPNVKPAEMLLKAHQLILDFLQEDDNDITDGMDIGLCMIDQTQKKINYIGAQRPLLMVSNEAEIQSDSAFLNSVYAISGNKYLHRFKGGIQSLGSERFDSNVYEHQLNFEKGDTLYLYTDGITDQFGGVEGKKFKTRRLIDMVDDIHQLGMNDQKKMVKSFFEEWKGTNEQIDDVTLLGIKL